VAITIARRELIVALGGAAAWRHAARAQPGGQMRRISVLMPGTEDDPQSRASVTAFEQQLQNAGWARERSAHIDYRWTDGKADLARAAAAELLSLAPDVIVAEGGQSLGELRRAALMVPVVFLAVDNPVFYGFIDSFAHPGRNMTGFTDLEPAVGAKWLELMSAIAPQVTRVGVVFNSRTAPGAVLFSRAAEATAQRFGIEVIRAQIQEPEEIAAAIAMMAQEPGGGLIFPVDPFTAAHRETILALAERHRLPALYGTRKSAAGGLVSYGLDIPALFRQAADYVDRILRGAQASELPVTRPTKFDLVINLKTAATLGLTVPPDLIAAADAVIR
jgi:putative ABC transport system substrate-binding protein